MPAEHMEKFIWATIEKINKLKAKQHHEAGYTLV